MSEREVHGLVLNGGGSVRMGSPKSELQIQGISLKQHMCSLLQQSGVKRVWLSGEDIEDIYSEQGPLAGIHAALSMNASVDWLVTPVDMPLLSPNLLKQLIAQGRSAQLPCYANQCWLPIYIPSSAQHIEIATHCLNSVQHRHWSMKHWLANQKSLSIDVPDRMQLNNANTPDEWQQCLSAYR